MKVCTWEQETPRYRRCRKAAVEGSSRCPEHQKVRPPRVGELPREVKEAVRRSYGHVCAICGRDANEVDHITPLSEFPYAERHKANRQSNLWLLCDFHHREKTAKEQRDRHGSDDVDPLDGMHDYHKNNRSRKKRLRRSQGVWYK